MSRFLFIVALFVVAGVSDAASAAKPEPFLTLDELEKRFPDEKTGFEAMIEFMEQAAKLVESNQLKSGEDFFRASKLAATVSGYDYRTDRVRYELLLAALAKDEPRAELSLASAWNSFLSTLGRPARLQVPSAGEFRVSEEERDDPAPPCIQSVFENPSRARAAAETTADNAEVKKLVDADQAARHADWSKLTKEEHHAIGEADTKRNRRIREIIKAGEMYTANDFSRAALVMQHSDHFNGYELAHELAVCSALLGDRGTGRWLIAATYDRMLNSVGHDQRFGTQSRGSQLMRVDEAGMCDAQRIALGCRSLDAVIGSALVTRAQALNQSGRFAEAEPLAREGLTRRERGYDAGSWQIFAAHAALGNSLLGQKKFAEAQPLLLSGYAGLKENQSRIPDPWKVRVRETAEFLVQLYQALEQPSKVREWQETVAEFNRAAATPP